MGTIKIKIHDLVEGDKFDLADMEDSTFEFVNIDGMYANIIELNDNTQYCISSNADVIINDELHKLRSDGDQQDGNEEQDS